VETYYAVVAALTTDLASQLPWYCNFHHKIRSGQGELLN